MAINHDSRPWRFVLMQQTGTRSFRHWAERTPTSYFAIDPARPAGDSAMTESSPGIPIMQHYTILVPAHDEARVIASTLVPLAVDGAPRILVICNGCDDDTAALARQALGADRVIETLVPGKAHAINLGLAAAPDGPVIVMDADISLDLATLDRLAAVLDEPGVLAAAPAAIFDTERAGAIIRGYYRFFAAHPYMTAGVGGSGVYGLSAQGRHLLGPLPNILSDDDYVRHRFALTAQRRVSCYADGRPLGVIVRTPRTLHELIRTESRWRAGDTAAAGATQRSGHVATLSRTCRVGGAGISALASYIAVKLAGRALLAVNRLRGRSGIWYRDTSSRHAFAQDSARP